MKNKEDLVTLVARDTKYRKEDLRVALNSFIKIAKNIVADGDELNISEFAKFYTDDVSQKQWDLNNKTFKNMSYKVIRAKFSDKFKAEVNHRD